MWGGCEVDVGSMYLWTENVYRINEEGGENSKLRTREFNNEEEEGKY